MRNVALFTCAAALFGLAPIAAREGAVIGALAFLALAIAVAFAASGGVNAIAAAAGAAGAFASAVLSPASAAASGAVLVALVFAERTTRVRGRTIEAREHVEREHVRPSVLQAVHVGIALVAGALAGALQAAYGDGALVLRAV